MIAFFVFFRKEKGQPSFSITVILLLFLLLLLGLWLWLFILLLIWSFFVVLLIQSTLFVCSLLVPLILFRLVPADIMGL